MRLSGERVDLWRQELRFSQKGLARKLGITEANAIRLCQRGAHGVYLDTFAGMIKASGLSAEELLAKIGADVVAEDARPVDEEIPMFDLSLAAGPWTDVSEVGETFVEAVRERGLFRARIAGDSMTPIYPDGAIVEFRRLRLDRESPVPTRDYYVQRSDGLATFKMLEKAGETEYVLRALNRRKYPQPLTVEKSLVVNMAAAVGKVELI